MATVNQMSYSGSTHNVPVGYWTPVKKIQRPELKPPLWQTGGKAAFRSASSFGAIPMVSLRPKAPLITAQSSLHQKPNELHIHFGKEQSMRSDFFTPKKATSIEGRS